MIHIIVISKKIGRVADSDIILIILVRAPASLILPIKLFKFSPSPPV
jgi:hypothetical protein